MLFCIVQLYTGLFALSVVLLMLQGAVELHLPELLHHEFSPSTGQHLHHLSRQAAVCIHHDPVPVHIVAEILACDRPETFEKFQKAPRLTYSILKSEAFHTVAGACRHAESEPLLLGKKSIGKIPRRDEPFAAPDNRA